MNFAKHILTALFQTVIGVLALLVLALPFVPVLSVWRESTPAERAIGAITIVLLAAVSSKFKVDEPAKPPTVEVRPFFRVLAAAIAAVSCIGGAGAAYYTVVEYRQPSDLLFLGLAGFGLALSVFMTLIAWNGRTPGFDSEADTAAAPPQL